MQGHVSGKRRRRQGQEVRDGHRRHQLRQRRRAGEAAPADALLPAREPLLGPRRQEKAHRHLRQQAGIRTLQTAQGN